MMTQWKSETSLCDNE